MIVITILSRIPNYDLMRMGKRGRANQIGLKFPLRAPGMENKRTEESEERRGVAGNNLLVGLVSKRKPGMEFLGKRSAF